MRCLIQYDELVSEVNIIVTFLEHRTMLGLMMAPRTNQARLPSRMATLPGKVKIETEHFHSYPIIRIILLKITIIY